MSNVKLYLDHPPTFVYHPQSQISGRAVCSFNTEKTIRKIRVRLIGKEHTEWRGTQSYYDSSAETTKTRTVTFEGDHEFIHYEMLLKGPGTIPKGVHTYPFKFTLSQLLPGSLTHKYGNIRYYMDVTVDRPYKPDFEDKRVFKVFSPIDLQRIDRRLLEPFHLTDEKTICCFWCASGPISVDVKLEKRAFAVGEKARMTIYCSNMSNVNVDNVKVRIEMSFKFKAKRPEHDSKTYSEEIAIWSASGVGAHGDRTYDVELLVPQSTVVPNFALCTLFAKECTLKISVNIEGAHSDIDFETPVALGHISSSDTSTLPRVHETTAPPFEFENTSNNTSLPPYPLDPHPSDRIPPYPLDPHPSNRNPPYPLDVPPAMPMPSGIPPSAPFGGLDGHSASAPSFDSNIPFAPPKAVINGGGAGGTSNIAPPSYDEAVGNI